MCAFSGRGALVGPHAGVGAALVDYAFRLSMLAAPPAPSVHLFVCANRRPGGSPLGPGCGTTGEAVFRTLKAEVAKRGAYRAIWVTQTLCLGICPKRGCTVAAYPRQHIVSEVEEEDAVALLERTLGEGAS
jgi:(2Fe-2S) ferredoxin